MSILFVDQFFSSRFIQALSWTLIHSLWIGMLAAMITGIVIISTKKTSALLRYNLLSVVFIGFLLATVTTFFVQYASFDNTNVIPSASNVQQAEVKDILQASYVQENDSKSFYDVFAAYFNANAPLVVLIWFLFFMFQSIKLFAGLHYIHKIRHQKITCPSDSWKNKLQQMSQKLGIQQQVFFLQSEIVKMPVVIGFLKPTILVPAGLLTNLPAEQVETILLHELAHIRRKDYFVNLLQSFAEAVFFFNPATIWISSLIREEREACCDDIVIANTGNKGSYLQALVSFHEVASKNNGYALALSGRKSFLFNRVKRMITYENKKLNIMEKLFLLTGVVVFSAFTFLTNAQKNKVNELPVTQAQTSAEVKEVVKPIQQSIVDAPVETKAVIDLVPPAVVVLDTVPKKTKWSNISTNINDNDGNKVHDVKAKAEDGKTYKYKKVNDKITELYVDDVKIPDSEISNYQAIFEEIDAMHAKRKADAEVRIKQAAERREAMAQRSKEQRARIDENRRELENKRRIDQTKRVQELKERNMLFNKRSTEERALIAERSRAARKNITTAQARRAEEQRRVAKLQNGINRRAIEMNRAKRVSALTSNSNATTSIINELVRDNVVESTDKLKFTLDSKKLVVNGKKQPDELHKRLKERYLKGDDDSIQYSKDKDGTRTTIVTN